MAGNANKVVVDVELRAQLDQMRGGVKELESLFKNLNLSPSKNAGMTQLFADMKKELKEIEDLTEGGKIKGGNFSKLEKSVEKVTSLYGKLGKEINTINSMSSDQKKALIPPDTAKQLNAMQNAINSYDKAIKNLAKTSGLNDLNRDLDKQTAAYDKLTQKARDLQVALELHQQKDELSERLDLQKAKVEALEEELKRLQAIQPNKANNPKLFQSQEYKDAQQEIKEIESVIKDTNEEITKTEAGLRAVNVVIKETGTANKSTFQIHGELIEISEKAEEAETAIRSLNRNIADTKSGNVRAAFTEIKNSLSQIQGLNLDWNRITNIDELIAQAKTLGDDALAKVIRAAEQMNDALRESGRGATDLEQQIQSARQAIDQATNSMQQISQLAQRGLYFFGLANTVNLVKKAFKDAKQVVQELDEAMTQTAVVTDYSVGDMWEQLPNYTKTANEYNATLKDTYDVMTLYYQQGLKQQQVFEVGEQTMKMARIAGLDYADATDRMTNALRGFNMEVNTTNSEHVADVYSKLAAISASNVEELSKAMTKTASLANSANMSFDNTAAFLAQIIETTRESAETAGTALKTVIARFSEVKSLFKEGDLIGEVEGEEVDINKVGTALRAAGVNLNEFMTGAKGLDEIFIELASKWDSLDLLTQRYIATMAAGSRQQSRFLALMSNNERLTELLNGAYGAAGASSEQFAKTQESLQSKLNNLKNAWDAFLMGIANSKTIKGAVDLGTRIITLLNKFLQGIEKVGGGLGRTAASLGLFFAAMKIGRTIIEAFSGQAIKIAGGFLKIGESAEESATIVEKLTTAFASFNLSTIITKITTGINALSAKLIELSKLKFSDVSQAFILGFSKIGAALTGLPLIEVSNVIRLINGELETTEGRMLALTALKTLFNLDDLQQAGTVLLAIKDGLGAIDEEGIKLLKTKGITKFFTEEGKFSLEAFKKEFSFSKLWGGLKGAFSSLGHALTTFFTSTAGIVAGIIIGTIGAAIATAYALWYNSAEQMSGRRLKAQQEATKELQEQVSKTKEKVDQLKSSWDELTNAQNGLENLVPGTEEFYEALIDVNNKVLELISNYSQLAQYLQIGENGELSISKAGYKQYLSILQNQYSSQLVQQAYQSAKTTQTENDIDRNKRYKETMQELKDIKGLNSAFEKATGRSLAGSIKWRSNEEIQADWEKFKNSSEWKDEYNKGSAAILSYANQNLANELEYNSQLEAAAQNVLINSNNISQLSEEDLELKRATAKASSKHALDYDSEDNVWKKLGLTQYEYGTTQATRTTEGDMNGGLRMRGFRTKATDEYSANELWQTYAEAKYGKGAKYKGSKVYDADGNVVERVEWIGDNKQGTEHKKGGKYITNEQAAAYVANYKASQQLEEDTLALEQTLSQEQYAPVVDLLNGYYNDQLKNIEATDVIWSKIGISYEQALKENYANFNESMKVIDAALGDMDEDHRAFLKQVSAKEAKELTKIIEAAYSKGIRGEELQELTRNVALPQSMRYATIPSKGEMLTLDQVRSTVTFDSKDKDKDKGYVGNVNTNTRPVVDETTWDSEEGLQTEYKTTYSANKRRELENTGKSIEAIMTTITEDGRELSETEIDEYLDEIIAGSNDISEVMAKDAENLNLLYGIIEGTPEELDGLSESIENFKEQMHSFQAQEYIDDWIQNYGKKYQKQIFKLLEDIPDTAIAGAKKIKEYLGSTDEAEQWVGKLASTSEKYKATAQFNDFYSNVYGTEDFQKALDKARENGKITASTISELSTEFSELNDYLSNGTVNSGGLAEALQLLGDHLLSTVDITNELIEAFSAFNATASAIADTKKLFDGSNVRDSSVKAISEGANSYYNGAKELAERGAWGDDQLYDYMSALLGTDENGKKIWDKVLAENKGNIEKAYNQAIKDAGYKGSGESIIYNQMVNRQRGLSKGYEDLYTVSGGKINFNFKRVLESGKTTTEAIQEAMGISLEQAKAIEAYCSQMSATFKSAAEAINALQGGQITLNSATYIDPTTGQAYVFMSDDQINILKQQMGKEDLSDSDFKQYLNDLYRFGEDDSEAQFMTPKEVAKESSGWTSEDSKNLKELLVNSTKPQEDKKYKRYQNQTGLMYDIDEEVYSPKYDPATNSFTPNQPTGNTITKTKTTNNPESVPKSAYNITQVPLPPVEVEIEVSDEDIKELQDRLKDGTAKIAEDLNEEWEVDSLQQQIANAISMGVEDADIAKLLQKEFSNMEGLTKDDVQRLIDMGALGGSVEDYLEGATSQGVVNGYLVAQGLVNQVQDQIAAYNAIQEANSLLQAINALTGIEIKVSLPFYSDDGKEIVQKDAYIKILGTSAGSGASSMWSTTYNKDSSGHSTSSAVQLDRNSEEYKNLQSTYTNAMAQITDDRDANGGNNGGGGGGGGDSDKDDDKKDPLERMKEALKQGGIWTSPAQLLIIKKQMDLLRKQHQLQMKGLDAEEAKKQAYEDQLKALDELDKKWADGSLTLEDVKDTIDKLDLFGTNGKGLQGFIDSFKGTPEEMEEMRKNFFNPSDEYYEYASQYDELGDERDQIIQDQIDQGVDWVNQGIEAAGQLAQSFLQMMEKVMQSMVDGFKSFLGWLTIRIDDEHDINELNDALKNRKELLDWEFDKLAEKDFDYSKGMHSKSQENLFENINDAAQNVLIRLQNQRRLYENSFRQLEDLGTNINSDIEASLEELYEALYGIDGIFTKINDKVQYLEQRFEKATNWNLTKLREWDPIEKINEFLGTSIPDMIADALDPLNLFEGSLFDRFFKKSLEQIAGLEITEYRLGNVGESLLQKIANFFYELSPKFDADYQIVNKSELVDALNQKMETIITNDTITAQFVQNYLDYLTEIESQMESEVENIRNAETEILSLYDEMTEILEKGKDEYGELEQAIYDAIVSEKESIKEELEELNSNITDADGDLINVLKNNLEQMRQLRENDKTESDLQDKEARLAYLRQDTSGANKQEILKLEKELKEGQQSYTDKLIDQKISELERQNEEAAEQRQIQIDLLQEEINNTKGIWEKVKQMMDAISGYGSWDDLLLGEIKQEAYQAIIDQLKKASDYEDMSSFAQDNQISDWGVLIRKASLYGTMMKDEYQEMYNDLKIMRDILDVDTKLPIDHAADSGWHDYVAFSNLETAVKKNTDAVQNAVSVINRIVDAKTLSFDETGSIFKKATESGATIQAMSGLEDAVKNFANDVASGLPGILTQVTTGFGNLAKGSLKAAGAVADTMAGAMTLDLAVGDLGEGFGMVMEGVSNLFAAGCDAASLMCDIIGDTSPGFTDMGVAAGTMIANWLDNAFEEVDEHLQENVGYIMDEMFGEEIDGQRLGGYYEQMGIQIEEQKDALKNYYALNNETGRSSAENEAFADHLFMGIIDHYEDIYNQIQKLDANDIEGFNKQYSRFLALQNILEKIGHTETVEKYSSDSIQNLEKWAGETGSIFAELSEKERQIVVDAINNAIYDVIKDETYAQDRSKLELWESNLKLKKEDIKYYNDIYKEFVDNVNYSVDAIDEAITAINSVFYDPYENEYTSPSAQLLVKRLEQLEGKRAEQQVENNKTIWQNFIDNASEVWGEFGNKILNAIDAAKNIGNSIITFLQQTFGVNSEFYTAIKNLAGGHALGGAIRSAERALVGELGPELVQHADGTASIVGRYGPEMADLKAGDQVYTAEQTKRILRGGGSINFNRFAEGTVGNFVGRAPLLPGLTSIDIATPTRALADGQVNRENNFNLNLSLEGLTVDSVDRVDEVANRVWDKLNTTISSAVWPYNKL